MNAKANIKIILSILTLVVGFLSMSRTGYASQAKDILKSHQPYLDLVVGIGQQVDPQNTQRMIQVFQQLRNRHPESAAKFLKGLRFEINEKMQRMGSTGYERNPQFRKWVSQYMKDWAREADEHLYRVASYPNSR